MTALTKGYAALRQLMLRRRSAISTVVVGVLVVALTSGCGEPANDAPQDNGPPDGDRRSMGTGRLLEQRGDLEVRERTWSYGDASSRARGYFRDDRLVYIDEEVRHGESGTTRHEYLLHDGRLIHFRRVGQHGNGNGTTPGIREVEVEILFDLDGRARVVRNLEDGIDRELDDTALQTIRSHFAIIRDRLTNEDP